MTLTVDLHIPHSHTQTVPDRGGDSGRRVSAAPASTRLRPNGSSGERRHVITACDGVGLACSDYGGPTARRTVVFLHGLCLSQQSWAHHVAYVQRRYGGTVRVISYDHRGHGQSQPAPVSTYRPDQLADDLAHVTAALEIAGSTTFVGHSMTPISCQKFVLRIVLAAPTVEDTFVTVLDLERCACGIDGHRQTNQSADPPAGEGGSHRDGRGRRRSRRHPTPTAVMRPNHAAQRIVEHMRRFLGKHVPGPGQV